MGAPGGGGEPIEREAGIVLGQVFALNGLLDHKRTGDISVIVVV